jgi:hypothetical protein
MRNLPSANPNCLYYWPSEGRPPQNERAAFAQLSPNSHRYIVGAPLVSIGSMGASRLSSTPQQINVMQDS